ncbi:MAG: hypothetical protein ABR570_10190 [Burkholderiales bacterium]
MTSYELLANTGLKEHLMFAALLIPTFVVIAAAAVSFVPSDEALVGNPVVEAVAICEPCNPDNEDRGPNR